MITVGLSLELLEKTDCASDLVIEKNEWFVCFVHVHILCGKI